MTRTISIKQTLKQSLAVMRHDLKKCRLPLIIFAVVAAFFTTAVLSLAIVSKEHSLQSLLSIYRNSSMERFGEVTTLLVFLLTSVFALIYCFKLFSYLHNKRKADRIAPMPIKAGVLFLTKTMTALLLTVIPSLFFVGIINIIASASGTVLGDNVINAFWQIPLGALACISFYALLAVCSGTKANAALTYLAICFSYTVAAFYVKGMIDSFFLGIPTNVRGEHFLMKALNPFAAYDGNNVVYWLIFSAVCIALSLLLLRFRKAERAQTSFAFRLPCYVVEALLTFITGMFMGVLFGYNKVTGDAFWGFVFGFALGGATGFTVTHAILFRGFKGILKSLICFGTAAAAGIILTAVCCFASVDYAEYLPAPDEVESAGFIEFTDEMLNDPHFSDVTATINDSAEDFTDGYYVGSIRSMHSQIVTFAENRSDATKFRGISITTLYDSIVSLFGQSNKHYSFAYKLKDGSTASRYYDLNTLMATSFYSTEDDFFDYFSYSDAMTFSDIKESKTYVEKYCPVIFLTADDLQSIDVDCYYQHFTIDIDLGGKDDIRKVLEALQADLKEHGEGISGDEETSITLKKSKYSANDVSVLSQLTFSDLLYNERSYAIPATYTNTINALKEVGIFKDNNAPNHKSKYSWNTYDPNEDGFFDGPYYSDSDEGFAFDEALKYKQDGSYSEGEVIAIGDFGDYTNAPWDYVRKTENGLVSIRNTDGDILMFQSESLEDISNYDGTYEGKEEKNAFADSFKVLSIESCDNDPLCCTGTARVKADGKEMTLRYIQFNMSDGEIFFVTDKVTEEEYETLYGSYNALKMY